MSSVAKILILLIAFCGSSAKSREMNILILGEGPAASCNQYSFAAVPHVFQLTADGGIKPASDPFDLTECDGGSVWIPLGQQLINSKLADRIIFTSIAVKKASVADWSPKGKAFPKLKFIVEIAKRKNIRFDYVFWQQGYSDANYEPERYFNDLRNVIRYLTNNAKIGAWIVGKGAGCPGVLRKGVEDAQARMARLPVYRRFPGPDTSRLASSDGFGECGLSLYGQNKMAEMWAQAVFNAEKNAVNFQKESLLYYFR